MNVCHCRDQPLAKVRHGKEPRGCVRTAKGFPFVWHVGRLDVGRPCGWRLGWGMRSPCEAKKNMEPNLSGRDLLVTVPTFCYTSCDGPGHNGPQKEKSHPPEIEKGTL